MHFRPERRRPTSEETGAAIKYLLTIDPKSAEFPAAWGIFIHLRQVDREVSRQAALDRGRLMLRNTQKNNGVSIGMTADDVRKSSWGKPRSINETITARGKHEQWVYGGGVSLPRQWCSDLHTDQPLEFAHPPNV